MINEEVVEEVLRGELEATKWAIPRTLKIFISSTRTGKSISSIMDLEIIFFIYSYKLSPILQG
jgi:hypothetical protein